MRALPRLLMLLTLAIAGPAAALNPSLALQDLNHTAWAEKDGVPSGITQMAQTPDGWLWLGTQDGLFRFDGVRFERYPTRQRPISFLQARDNGELYFSFMGGGLSVVRANGRIDDIDNRQLMPLGGVIAMEIDADQVMWLITWRGLYRYADQQLQLVAGGREWTGNVQSLLRDQYDRLWVANETGVFLIDRAARKMVRRDGVAGGLLTQAPDGQIWAATYHDELLPVPMPPAGAPLPRRANFNQQRGLWSGQFDRDGNLWVGHCLVGVCRIRKDDIHAGRTIRLLQPAADKLDQPWQLSSIATDQVLEDREGNLWISTSSGLDRFRENRLIPARIPSQSTNLTIATDSAQRIWAADFSDKSLWMAEPGKAPVRDPRPYVQMVATDRHGALLLATRREIERVEHQVVSKIPLPTVNGQAADLYMLGLLDDGKVLWIATMQTGLMGYVDGRWLPPSAFKLPPGIMISGAGASGQLWLGHYNGKAHFYDNGKLSEYDDSVVGQESGFFHGPQVVAAGEHGIAVLRGQRFELLGPAGVEPLRNVTGMVITPDGDHWFNGLKGVVRVPRAHWEAALKTPGAPLQFELLDAQEGYPGKAQMINRMRTGVYAGNGRMWFLGSGGLVRLEASQQKLNDVKPTIQVMRLNSDTAVYPAAASLRLPPETRNFNIQYTSPGLRQPEGVKFQYMLDGVDKQWVDAGSRRAAYYTNVGPGNYTFRVRASNEDGVSSASVASMAVEVAPTVLQSWWFRLLCVMLALAAAVSLYRYRIRSVVAQAARQAEARTDERERIARTLHDTFLQSVYALVLQVYAILVKMPKDSEDRLKLETVLNLANRTIDEGRAQVQQLRTGYDPELMLQRIGESMSAIHSGTSMELQTAGTRRKLSAAAQEEFSGVGQEALHNAFQHAEACRVTVDIVYAADSLILRIHDNGKGISDDALQGAARGHWGLTGMRERAQRIGAQLSFASRPGEGTTVELKIPARVAYDAHAA